MRQTQNTANKQFNMMLILLFSLLALKPQVNHHPFFVSVIEAEYYRKENLIGISCKIFNEDLEQTLKKHSGTPIDIIKGDKNANVEKMKSYFFQHFQVKVNNKTRAYHVLGYTVEKEACFVFLEIKDSGDPQKIEFTTDLLYDLDKSQVNLVHFIRNGERQTQKLDFPNTQAVFEAK